MTINDISFSDVGYIDIENSPVTDYSSFVDLIVKQSSRFVDVIKERRHYYQWSAKKSAEHESGIRDLNEGGSAEAVVR